MDQYALRQQLIRHEGLRLTPYRDTVGKLTIGVGRNLDDVGISHEEALHLLNNDIVKVLADLDSFPWFHRLDDARQRVVVDMRFNLGAKGFRSFKTMLAALARHDYRTAAQSMRRSKWAGQVKQRAVRLIYMMEHGTDAGF